MRIIICSNYEELSNRAASIVSDRIKAKPALVLGLVAGDTPTGLYRRLVELHGKGELSFSRATVFLMNEYLTLSRDHPRSIYASVRKSLFDHVDLDPSNIISLDGLTSGIEEHCAWFEEQIKNKGGIDLQVLGIGRDGHIGFNEPGSSLSSHTRRKALNEVTIHDNSRYFSSFEEVPKHALTAGAGTIIQAREILLMASGCSKAEAIAEMIEGPISNQVTASILQVHPRVNVIIDEAATECLENLDYYRYLQEQTLRYDDKP